MMDLGSGVALAGVSISAAAVAITAIRVFNTKRNGKEGNSFPCKEHSGLVEGINSIRKNQERQEKWLGEISGDVKILLRNTK
ncbi:MAG: hypothetical protein ABIH34_04335 [Nanoarchaeota archaeon]